MEEVRSMDFLGGWLKTVITVILLATFVDLLLPSNKMQRYVKTVISLFILLTLLSPIIELFHRSWNPDSLFAMVEEQETRMAAAEGGKGQMPSLEAIRQKADQMKAANERQAQQLTETQLAGQIKQSIEEKAALPVWKVEVKTAMDKQKKPYIEQVRVVLGHKEERKTPAPVHSGDSTPAGMAPVKPVEPVRIDIGKPDPNRAFPASGRNGEPPEFGQDKERIAELLKQDWQVPSERIDVRYEPDQTKS
jgi:stage III sporulation protein AF